MRKKPVLRYVRWAALPAALLLVGLIPLGLIRADDLPTLSIRELVIRARLVVVARPLDPLQPKTTTGRSSAPTTVRFKVIEVLSSEQVKVGDTVQIADLSLYHLGRPAWRRKEGEVVESVEVDRALLFLVPGSGRAREPAFREVVSGIRYLTKGGEVLRPQQLKNPGPYHMLPVKGATWASLTRRVRSDVGAVGRVMALRDIPDAQRRNQAIFKWIEDHRPEFGGGLSLFERYQEPKGWASLEWKPFEWVMDSCIPEDCWRALTMYAQLNPGARSIPEFSGPSFGSPEGRRLLLDIVTDEKRPQSERVLAMWQLAGVQNLWAHHRDPASDVRRLSQVEQQELIARLVSLLNSQDESFQLPLVRAIYWASDPRDGAIAHRGSKQALRNLAAAHAREGPGEVRDELAKAIRGIGGKEHWQGLTGNPQGILVLLYGFHHSDNKVSFWLDMEFAHETVYECPTLVLRRVDRQNRVLDTKREPLPTNYLPKPWRQGWDGAHHGNIGVLFASNDLEPGKWVVFVEGSAGKGEDKVSWKSEPKAFVVPAGKPAP